jgi:hypothetical protein
MTQQFRIESEQLRDKLNTLLPSQNRGSIGVDLSGSTTIIPIVDLTEVAEGSSLRQDLQTSLSFDSITTFEVVNSATDIINTTGYWRVFGSASFKASSRVVFTLIDAAATQKIFLDFDNQQTTSFNIENFDFIVKLEAGDILRVNSFAAGGICRVAVRQIATLAEVLVNP